LRAAPAHRAGAPLHVLRVADRHHEPSHHTGVRRPCDDDDRERRVLQPAPEHGRHDHRQDDRREREDEIGGAHQRAVDEAAEVAGDGTDCAADRRGDDDQELAQSEP